MVLLPLADPSEKRVEIAPMLRDNLTHEDANSAVYLRPTIGRHTSPRPMTDKMSAV
jgi:hypothetical protein